MIHSARPTLSPVAKIVFASFCFARFWKVTDGRTDICKNNYPYRPWMWVGRVDQYNIFTFLLYYLQQEAEEDREPLLPQERIHLGRWAWHGQQGPSDLQTQVRLMPLHRWGDDAGTQKLSHLNWEGFFWVIKNMNPYKICPPPPPAGGVA